MPRTSRPALLITALAALLLGSGCATAVPGTAAPADPSPSAESPPAAAASPEAVAWMDDVCGALLPFGEATAESPPTVGTDPAAAVPGISSYLTNAGQSLDDAIDGVAAAGPSPVQGGDAAAAELTEALKAYRSTFQDAKTRIDAIDVSDPQALATELPATFQSLGTLADVPNPTALLDSNPELVAAAQQAAKCQQMVATVR